jgi:hypothetical protein
MTADNQPILHFVDPIARFRDLRIVGHEQKRLALLLHDPPKQFESAPGILAVQVSGRLIGQDDTWIVREGTRDGHPLLFATGKMAARPFRLFPETDFVEEKLRTLDHFRFAQLIQAPHRDHYVFLRGKIFEEKMELEDESEEFIPLSRQRVVHQMGDVFILDAHLPAIGLIEEAKNVEERAFAAAGWAYNGVDRAALELERDAAQGVDAILVLAEISLDPFAAKRDFRFHEF